MQQLPIGTSDVLSLTNAHRQAVAGDAASNAQTPEEVREAAKSFEAFFLHTALEQMSKGLGTDDYFGGGNAEAIWRSYLNEEIGKDMAESGGIGIANIVERDLLGADATYAPPRNHPFHSLSQELPDALPLPLKGR